MNKEKRIEVEIPFWGFYESLHDSFIDDALEMHFQNDDGDIDPEDRDLIWEADIDWKAIQKEYCERFVEELSRETELDFEFIEMTSPREYNFSSDRLFASLPANQIAKIRKEVESYPDWANVVKERFTSYSGFSSNYSPDITDEEWSREILDECQYLVMLERYFEENLPEDWQLRCAEDINVYEMSSIGIAAEKVHELIKKKEGGENVSA